jgi:hypothetical protein
MAVDEAICGYDEYVVKDEWSIEKKKEDRRASTRAFLSRQWSSSTQVKPR